MPRFRRATACALALLLTSSATAVAAATADTSIEVAPRVEIAAHAASPATFPGVTGVRAGARLPRGWVVVGRDVQITRGSGEPAFAAFRIACPQGKTWRSGTGGGAIGVNVLSRSARGRRSVLVMATFSTSAVAVGEVAAGTVYALCR